MRLHEILVRPVCAAEESRFQDSIHAHHYLGALPKIGNTLWHIACFEKDWVAGENKFTVKTWGCTRLEVAPFS